jgi:hypothetical protein
MNKPISIGRSTSLWTVLGVLLAIAPAAAQQQAAPNAVSLEEEVEEIREYAVEIIIFEYAGSAAGSTEIFDPEPPPEPDPEPDLNVTIPARLTARRERIEDLPEEYGVRSHMVYPDPEELELISTFEQSGFRLLAEEERQLTDTYNRLVNLDAYRPLVHAGWVQPIIELAEGTPITLRRIADPPLRLDGTVSLYLSRFLHLVVDLALETRQPAEMTGDRRNTATYDDRRNTFAYRSRTFQQSTFFRIQEDQIMRNNEVRYLDHPKFGVIARVSRIEAPVDEEPDTTGDLLPGVVN